MTRSARWEWLPTPEYGGQDGSVLTKLFKGKENLTAEELLAREVIQNSWDAARVLQAKYPDTELSFRMVFRFASLHGEAKRDMIQAAGLRSLKARRDVIPEGSELDEETALRFLDDADEPLRVLYLEDYGSHGLFGDPEILKADSHLFKALYLVGGTGKADEDAPQGGAFGFGKSAFVRASGTNTVIAHSRFEPLDADLVTSRLVGFTWWPGHKVDSEHYEGRAIYGRDSNGHIVPFTDDEADEWAKSLGMPPRDSSGLGELGTTFLLIDPVVDPDALKKAVEIHWWPALEEHLIDVEVVDYEGNSLIPRPSKVDWLQPYLEAYRIALDVSPVVDPEKQRRPSDKWRNMRGKGIDPGELGLVISDVEPPEDMSGPRVALIRSPRMVIEYKEFLRKTLPMYGSFIASEDADPFLRKTEPPAHDLWDAKPNTDTPSEATAVAKGTISRIRNAVQEFADDFQPPPPQDGQRLTHMARVLSAFLRDKPVIPPPEPEPVSIQLQRPEEVIAVSDGLIAVSAGIRICLTDTFADEYMDVSITCPVIISEDEGGHGETWPASLSLRPAVDGFSRQQDGSWRGRLRRDVILDFDLQSEPFDAGWTAIVFPKVENLSKASGKESSKEDQ